MQINPTKYHFRRRDYMKIRNWYDFAKLNFVPEEFDKIAIEPQRKGEQNKKMEFHYRLFFKTVTLTQLYINQNITRLMKLEQIIILTSIYNRKKECILSNGREQRVKCKFEANDLLINLEQQILLFFYFQDLAASDYQLFVEMRVVDQDGGLYKLGASRWELGGKKDEKKEGVMILVNNLWQDRKRRKQIQEITTSQNKSKSKLLMKQSLQPLELHVGKIQFQLDTEPIKQIKRYLPPYKIIDRQSKIAPTSFNLRKKKQQLSVEVPYQLVLEDLMLRVENFSQFKRQVLGSNPFSFSHKELVEYQIVKYRVIIDNHNGWKFFRQGRNQIQLELVVEKGDQLYLSSKRIHNIMIQYYQSDLLNLIVMLLCKVQFKLNGQTDEKRTKEFLVGWLPLPFDLALKENKIELIMVNDLQFPTMITSLLGVQSTLTASFTHPNYQKYKAKHDQKKVFAQELISDHLNASASQRYLKLKSRKQITESLSEQVQLEHASQINAQITAYKNHVKQNEIQRQKQKFVKMSGRAELGDYHGQNTSMLPIQSTVGKMMKLKIEIDTLIPQTDCSSQYYLPKKMKATVYFLRQSHHFSINIPEKEARFHIPVRINNHKSTFYFQTLINSMEEFQDILSSRMVITLYEEEDQRLYAKGITSAHDILGAVEGNRCAFVRIFKWHQNVYKIFGTLLVNVDLAIQKLKEGRSRVQQVDINKIMKKLPMQQRMKMRVSMFKGDQNIKSQIVSKVKQSQQKQYISTIVSQQLQCDGQLQYQLGKDSYHLLQFTNNDKSDNNIFTFHLGCIYAEIVTDHEEYLSVIQKYNFERLNYQHFQFVMQQPQYFSYYQTKLRYTQEIGVLVKLNVSQYGDKEKILSKFQVVVKRNTIENKKFFIKCKFKQSLVFDIVHDYALQEQQGKAVHMKMCEQITQNYYDILVLNKLVSWSNKTKELVINKPERNKRIILLGQPINQKQRRIIFYQLLIIPGTKLSLCTGQPHHFNIHLQNHQLPAQIIKCSSPQIQILNSIKFTQQEYNDSKDIKIVPLKPYSMKNHVVGCYDLSGKLLSQYLIKIQSNIQFISAQMEISYDESSHYSVLLENPFPCPSQFTIFASNKAVHLQHDKIKLEGYSSRLVMFSLVNWSWDQHQLYIYMLDPHGYVCQVVEITCKVPKIMLSDEVFEH